MFKIAVLYGHGINCDKETLEVLNRVIDSKESNGKAKRVHTNEFIRGEDELKNYQMLVFPGGFLHGDDISAGKILANKLKTKLSKDFENFVQRGKLVLGICNGFQVLAKHPILPSLDRQKVTLTWNDSGRYEDRWVWLKINENSPCVYSKGIDKIRLPIRHGEGKFIAEDKVLDKLEKNNQVALRYAKRDGSEANGEFPYNPNGSMRDIAGICDKTGRVFGLMPHPEAFHSLYNYPNWIELKKKGKGLPETTGVKMFENAVEFIQENLI